MPSDQKSPGQSSSGESAGATATRLLQELKSLKSTVAELQTANKTQQETINRQQALLLNAQPESLKASTEDKKPTNPQEFLNLIVEKVSQITDQKISAFGESLLPIIKAATPEAKVWDKNKVAGQLMEENPGLTTELALELADKRMAEAQAKEEAERQEAEKLEQEEISRQAALGHPSNTSTSADTTPPGRTIQEIMEAQWDATGMEEATQRYQEDMVDDWGPSPSKNVEIILPDPSRT